MKKIILIGFLIFFYHLTDIYPQDFAWEIYTEMPLPVAGGSAQVINDAVLIFGGYSDSLQRHINWIQEYDFNTYLWSIPSYMKEARYGSITGVYNNMVYICGGVQRNIQNSRSIEQLVVGEDYSDSTTLFDFNPNFERIFSTGSTYNEKFYIIGGNSLLGGDKLSYIAIYDLDDLSLTSYIDTLFPGATLPEQQMSARIDDEIFIFGGVLNGVTSDIMVYNIAENKLKILPVKLKTPRAGGVAVRFGSDNSIFVIGGYNESSKAIASVEIFKKNGLDYTLEDGPDILIPRRDCMAIYYEDSIYLIGGFDQDDRLVKQMERFGNIATSIGSEVAVPSKFELKQNYPNPFNPTTTIMYQIPAVEHALSADRRDLSGFNTSELKSAVQVTLKIYDVLGKEVATLVDEKQKPGEYSVIFDAGKLRSGIYYYRLSSDSYSETKKMIFLK